MSNKFTGKLSLDFLDEPVDGNWFQIIYSFSYISENGIIYEIPAGTFTDFASTKWFRSFIPQVGRYGKAAVLHDYLCACKYVSRKRADKLFLEAMKLLNVGWVKRRIMYIGVRSYSIATFKK